MEGSIHDNTLLDTNEKYQQVIRLIILKLATSWLEKQDWVSNPYGGQNPLQDLIFQAQLSANRVWEDFFSKKTDQEKIDVLKSQILQLSELTPELQLFFENKLKFRLNNHSL